MNKKTPEGLEREGWEVASVTSGEHLRRTLEMYQELGIETFLEEINPEQCGGCTACYQSGNETMCRIYTKTRRFAA